MSDETALRAAQLLGRDESHVLTLAAMERASTEKAKAAWSKLAHRLQRSVTTGVIAALGIALLLNSQAASAMRDVCILC